MWMRVGAFAVASAYVITNFTWQIIHLEASDADLVSTAASHMAGYFVASAFLPTTKFKNGRRVMQALLLGITYVGLAGAWKDWNDHTYTAYNRFLRTVPQTITGLAAVAAFVSGHRFTCDWWELLRAASAVGASVMVVVAAAAAHGNAHGAEPQLCFHPGCHSPTLFAIWGAVWLAISAVLTPNVRVFISDHTGLGMRVVGLEFLNPTHSPTEGPPPLSPELSPSPEYWDWYTTRRRVKPDDGTDVDGSSVVTTASSTARSTLQSALALAMSPNDALSAAMIGLRHEGAHLMFLFLLASVVVASYHSSSLGFAFSFQLLGFVVAAWTAFTGVCVAAPFDRPAMTAIVAATGVMSCAAGISAARIHHPLRALPTIISGVAYTIAAALAAAGWTSAWGGMRVAGVLTGITTCTVALAHVGTEATFNASGVASWTPLEFFVIGAAWAAINYTCGLSSRVALHALFHRDAHELLESTFRDDVEDRKRLLVAFDTARPTDWPVVEYASATLPELLGFAARAGDSDVFWERFNKSIDLRAEFETLRCSGRTGFQYNHHGRAIKVGARMLAAANSGAQRALIFFDDVTALESERQAASAARERALQEERLRGFMDEKSTALVVLVKILAPTSPGFSGLIPFAISSPMRALVIEWRERHGLAVDERTSDAIFCEWTTHLQRSVNSPEQLESDFRELLANGTFTSKVEFCGRFFSVRGTKYSNGEAMVQLFDVTEQQRLEAQMQKGSLALQRVADVVLELELPAWTAEGVRNARLTHATPSFEALFGIPAEAEPGFWTTLCADSSSKDVLHSALLTCERRVEVRFRRRRAVPDKVGSPVIELRTVCVSTAYAPELTGTHTLILICHDLTDFKERIELQKDRELIATLQHEEKNTNQAQELDASRVAQMVDELEARLREQRDVVHEHQPGWVDFYSAHADASRTLQQMRAVVGDVVERAREAQQQSHSRIMLRQLARDEYVLSPSRVDVTSALRQQLGRGSQIAVSPSFHGELMVDWNLLWHAISNALSNARKYGDKASIEVRLNYQPPDLVVTVVNSADAREQARLMAKHGQDATGLLQRRIEGGTALSSNLGSRAILQAAALHGGRATLRLAAAETTLELVVHAEAAGADFQNDGATPGAAPLLWCVDDCATMRLKLRQWLRPPFHPASRVFPDEGLDSGDADSAIDEFATMVLDASPQPDVVLLDQNLRSRVVPTGNVTTGTEIARALRAGGYAGTVVICTANVTRSSVEQYRTAGANHVLSKDQTADDLLHLLRISPETSDDETDALVDRGAEVWTRASQADQESAALSFAVSAGKAIARARALFGQCDAAADGLYRVPDELHQLIGQCRAVGARRLLRDAEQCRLAPSHTRLDALDDVLHETWQEIARIVYRGNSARAASAAAEAAAAVLAAAEAANGISPARAPKPRHHLSAPPPTRASTSPAARGGVRARGGAGGAAAEYAAACGAARQMWGVDVRAAPAADSPPAARLPRCDSRRAIESLSTAPAPSPFDPAAAPAFGGEQVITAAQWAIFDQDSARVVRTLLDGENHYVAALHQLRGQALVVGAPRLVRMVKALEAAGRAPTAEEVRSLEDARRAALPTAGFCPTTGAALTGATLTGRSDTPVTAVAPFTPKKDPIEAPVPSVDGFSLSPNNPPPSRVGSFASLAPTEEAVSTPMNASPMNAAHVPHVVMVVDDDAFQLSVQAQKVRELGHTVIEAGGGAQALAILATRDVDLAIIDINMPGVDGCGVARAVRAGLTLPRARPRLVAISADGDDATCQKRALSSGFVKVLVKPLTADAVVAAFAPGSLASPSRSRAPGALRVLIADDCPIARRVLVRNLTCQWPGAVVTEVETGEAALALLTPENRPAAFDLALLDQSYINTGAAGGRHRMLGTEVSRRAREHELSLGGGRRLVMVGVTGHASEKGHAELARVSGQDHVLGKPTPQKLPASLLALLPTIEGVKGDDGWHSRSL